MDTRADIMTEMEIKKKIDAIVSLAGRPLGMPDGLADHAINSTLADRVNQEILHMGNIREYNTIIKVQDYPGGLKRAYVIILFDEYSILSGKGDGTNHDEAAFYALAAAFHDSPHGV